MLIFTGKMIVNLATCRHAELHVEHNHLKGMTVYYTDGAMLELNETEAAHVYGALMALNNAKQESRIVPPSGLIH
jgi:hypothetical protein